MYVHDKQTHVIFIKVPFIWVDGSIGVGKVFVRTRVAWLAHAINHRCRDGTGEETANPQFEAEGIMSIELLISSNDLRGQALQEFTENLCETLMREAKLDAAMKKGDSYLGAKGEPITIGVIVLSFITSGAAVALLNAISAHFARSNKIEVSMSKANGDTFTLKSENMAAEQHQQTLKQLEDFLKS